MRVLITGINSAIGKLLASKLLSNGCEVIGLGRNLSGEEKYKRIEFDLLKNAKPAISDVDICLHLAALRYSENPELLFRTNVYGTQRILEIAKESGVHKFIYISTGAVYGYRDEPLTEDMEPNPFDMYSLTKYQGELVAKSYSQDFQVIVLRYFFPYGPLTNKNRLINRLIDNILKNRAILLHNENKPVINPIYISDLIDATILVCVKTTSDFEIFNIAGKESVHMLQLASMISDLLGIDAIYEKTGNSYKNMVGDTQKIKQRLKFEPKVSLKQGLKLTTEWYKNDLKNHEHHRFKG